jgi:TonB family protein
MKDIRSGDYTFRFTLPNFEAFETEVSVIAGIVTPFHAKLEPVLGAIVVTVQPEGSVFVDDELVGRGVSGLSRFEVTPGPHTVRVENAEYGVRELPVEVRPSRSAELTVNFIEEGVDQLVREADQLFGAGEFLAAKEIYQKAAALAPSNALVAGKLSEISRLIDAQYEQEATEAIIEDGVYLVVDTPPQLIGGLEALHKTVRYPEAAFKAGVEGRVFVQFVVDEEGNPSDLKISRGLPLGCNEAAMEAIGKAKFIPGEFKGRKVKVRHTLFINFRI